MANRCFIGLGSNIDDRITYIQTAIEQLSENECEVTKVSSIYETLPYGYTEQNNFLNCVVEISTKLSLRDVFNVTKGIEQQIGRKKREKWGPREIDLDILFYNEEIYSDEKLTVPHKDVMNRDFVLVPLCEIAAGFIHPKEKIKICDIALDQSEKNIIRKFNFQYS